MGAAHGKDLLWLEVVYVGLWFLRARWLLFLEFPFLGVLRGGFLCWGGTVRVGFFFAFFRIGHFSDQLLQLFGELLGGNLVDVLQFIGRQSDFLQSHFQWDLTDLNIVLLWVVTESLWGQEGSDSLRDWDSLELDADFGTWWLHLLREGRLGLLGWLSRVHHWLMMSLEVGAHHGAFRVWGLHHLGGNWGHLLGLLVAHDRDGEHWSGHLAHDGLWGHLLGQMGNWTEGTDWWDWDEDLADGLGVFVPGD